MAIILYYILFLFLSSLSAMTCCSFNSCGIKCCRAGGLKIIKQIQKQPFRVIPCMLICGKVRLDLVGSDKSHMSGIVHSITSRKEKGVARKTSVNFLSVFIHSIAILQKHRCRSLWHVDVPQTD